MSILQQVMKEYGISETSKPLTDKTDKRASVSSVSDRPEGFETQYVANEDELKKALEDDWDEVSNDPEMIRSQCPTNTDIRPLRP